MRDQTSLLHAAERNHRSRLHHADARGEFALRQAVLRPQYAQEIPLPAGDAVAGDAFLQEPLEGAVRVAHEIARALERRVFVGFGLRHRRVN
jgi:hypothetical protein